MPGPADRWTCFNPARYDVDECVRALVAACVQGAAVLMVDPVSRERGIRWFETVDVEVRRRAPEPADAADDGAVAPPRPALPGGFPGTAVAVAGPLVPPGTGSPASDRVGRRRLTARERDILRLLATGRTDKEIATTLAISYRTVTNHVGSILAKLGVESRTAAALYAVRYGLADGASSAA